MIVMDPQLSIIWIDQELEIEKRFRKPDSQNWSVHASGRGVTPHFNQFSTNNLRSAWEGRGGWGDTFRPA